MTVEPAATGHVIAGPQVIDAGCVPAPASKSPPDATAVTVTVYGPSVLRSSGFANWSAIDKWIVEPPAVAQLPLPVLGVPEAVI